MLYFIPCNSFHLFQWTLRKSEADYRYHLTSITLSQNTFFQSQILFLHWDTPKYMRKKYFKCFEITLLRKSEIYFRFVFTRSMGQIYQNFKLWYYSGITKVTGLCVEKCIIYQDRKIQIHGYTILIQKINNCGSTGDGEIIFNC